jgi:hypothetical protein
MNTPAVIAKFNGSGKLRRIRDTEFNGCIAYNVLTPALILPLEDRYMAMIDSNPTLAEKEYGVLFQGPAGARALAQDDLHCYLRYFCEHFYEYTRLKGIKAENRAQVAHRMPNRYNGFDREQTFDALLTRIINSSGKTTIMDDLIDTSFNITTPRANRDHGGIPAGHAILGWPVYAENKIKHITTLLSSLGIKFVKPESNAREPGSAWWLINCRITVAANGNPETYSTIEPTASRNFTDVDHLIRVLYTHDNDAAGYFLIEGPKNHHIGGTGRTIRDAAGAGAVYRTDRNRSFRYQASDPEGFLRDDNVAHTNPDEYVLGRGNLIYFDRVLNSIGESERQEIFESLLTS